jgi:hypothetical protein
MKSGSILLFSWLCCLGFMSHAQVKPAPNSQLNYTHVMFEYPQVKGAVHYQIEVIESSSSANYDKGFKISQTDSTIATLIKGLKFGKSYKWRSIAFDANNKSIQQTEYYRFNTLTGSYLDEFRFKKTEQYNGKVDDGLIFIDYARVAIDRSGTPVWFLSKDKMIPKKVNIRDMRMTKAGTITSVPKPYAFEFTIEGRKIWRGPAKGVNSNAQYEFHHHDLQKLSNGNYMVLTKRFYKKILPFDPDTSYIVGYSSITEWKPDNTVAWTWDAQRYLANSDLEKERLLERKSDTYAHNNGFQYNEKNNEIYLSFRDLNSIIVIDKKSGSIKRHYGDGPKSRRTTELKGQFKKQHAPVLLSKNELMFFNNNDSGSVAQVAIINLNNGRNASIDWTFDCNFDDLDNGQSHKMGYVDPLPNGNILVNMGYKNRLFEVTRDKQVVWDGFMEHKSTSGEWEPMKNYRANFFKSLYPTYFTVEKLDGKIRINNEGNEIDAYKVGIERPSDGTITLVPPIEIKPGTSHTMNVGIGAIVTIESTNNSKQIKTITFE